MEKEFVNYTEALALKELGFDEPCLAKHDLKHILLRIEECKNQENAQEFDYILAPLYQQAFRWFREKYGLCSWITMELGNKSTFCWVLSGEHTSTQYAAYFHTYEEAELACLTKLIEIVKNKIMEKEFIPYEQSF
jgi:hypothetical protein